MKDDWFEKGQKLWMKAFKADNHIEAEKIIAEALRQVAIETMEDCAKITESCKMTLVTPGYDRMPRELIAGAIRHEAEKLRKETI